ncbi:uncharacterized protein LOC119676188 [Teleopsis dalmanni]|uniref:uncharacterized protein LOC119676188 n=1 Tax=Teleopsis dalmanni TaxID=139649 RepID=UPI0018CDD639|nr:uncharacterized protein LOC119676188 [Teleopsis dalmanni]
MENITDIVNIDQTYQQPIQSSTNVSHETAIRNVLENAFNSQTEAYNDEKERIKVIIIEEITERKSNLLQVKNCIEREYEKSLSSIDNAYIEQKYMKYCTELWMEKVTALVQATTECNDTKLIQTILSSIDKIKTLSDIPESFKQLEYYKNLVDHYHFISENKKKNLISQFKEECLVPIFAYSATAQKESIFLEAFVDLLSSSRNIQSIINKLRLADFCMGVTYNGTPGDGSDGYPGESGGNVLILVNKIENPENFTIISNGGNGSVGQDGGDGKNGVDGKGIINSDFCEKFPPVSKLFCYSRWKNVEKTINSIKSDLQEIKIGWYRDWTFCDPYTKNVFNDIHDAIIADGDIFLNTITEQGNEITFSYQAPNLFYNCQSFLLYKGSLGKPGSPGGRNGIGGQGGYPGDIIVRNVATNQQILVTTQSKEGTAGKNGKAGKYGNHGKNGWDMGYIDYSIGDKWPKIFGTDQNSKLMLKYHEDNSSERVHCPYKIDNYDKYSYVEITSSNIMDKKETKYEERNSDELNRNRQHHAQAVRKKNISQSNIEANYSVYCNNTTDKNSIKSMQLEIEKINQQIRQAMTENQEAQKNQTTESKIECKWKFIKQKDYNYKERKDLKRIIRSDRTDRKSIQDLLNEVKCPQSNFDNWFHLQDIEIKIDEINEFLSYFEIWKSEILKKGSKLTNTQNKLKEIELLLIDKYRFATLQVIAMQLVSHNKVKSKIELTAETVLKYLVKDKTKNNDISHSILGTLSQYLYEDKKEQREKIVNYCETDLLSCDENIQSFKRSIQVFILEERKSEVDFLDCLKKYFNEYTQFLEEKDHKFKTFFCAFKRELTKPLHRKVLDLWNRSIKDVSLKQELKNKIKNDKLLNALYIRFNKQLTLQYDWEKCCKDKDVLKEYYNYIRGKGPLSKSYRELLAHLFNVNIRLYISDIKYDLSLRDNHNPSSKIAIHAVQISNEFIQYSIDENYLKLVEEREYKNVNCFTENDIKTWVKKNSGCNELNVTLLVINRAIQLKRGFKLRATQILTVLAFLTTDQSTLAQVSTGEGKTLIIVAISLIKLLRGEMVDIVTSSYVLAKRDSETNKDIYNLFGFDVSHNCSEDIEKRKEIYSCNQIVYGDLSNFQRDYLLDRFYGKNILGHHDFANIIVDEVDSMLLDKGNNMLYLTHDIADLDKLSSVFIYIWQWIKRPVKYSDDFISLFDTEAIKESVLNELYGYVKKEDIGNLGSDLSDQHKTIIWQRLVSADIIDNHGKLLKENINDSQLNEILLPEFITYKDRLNYLLIECIKRNTYIRVPNYLKSFVENHLDSWINNAITAFFMKAERDYVVDIDRSGTYADRNPIITIIDTDTGTDEVNSQWDEGLHQFLQLKHGCKITSQSLKAVFISNISFFKLYRTLYGLTGSLGSQRERDLLKEIHKVDFVTIPTAVPKQFQEYKPILCINKKEWITYIKQEVNKIIEENYRSVLIICETVHNVEVLYKAFGGRTARGVHKYVRDYEEFDVAQGKKELDQGQIIIATNLSGRGTDIKITKKLREAGGLHICLTYLPRNIRVEQQAFGRAARCGDRGSGQLIILDSYGTEKSIAKVLDLKKERDINEVYRISNIKTYYDFQIYEEERCFNEFKKQFEELKKILSVQNVRSEIKEILLRSCLDQWTFWLDKNCHHIKMISDEQQKHNFYKRFDDFITKLKNFNSECSRNSSVHRRNYNENWLNWVDGNPVQMIKLGKYFSQNNEHKNSIKDAIRLFDDVIRMEPYFSEAAHYYKAFALTKCNRASSKQFEMELQIAAKLIDEHIRFVMITSGIINEIKENNNSIIRINAFREQQEITLKLYHMFLQSIDDIFGHNITPQSFSNYDINEELSEKIYKDLIKNKILSKMKVKHNISEDDIDTICFNYGISTDMLKSFLSKYVDINESAFLKDLKKEIKLPNKEEFWKLLMEKNVLIDDVQFIIVDIEKLNEIDPSLLDSLRSQNEFEQKSLDDNNGYILFNTSVIPRTQRFITFKKDEFVKYVGKEKYKSLKKKRIFSFNRKSLLNIVNTKSITFPCYDSITPEDFNKININNNEAVNILTELCEQSVIEDIGNNIYRLKIKFYEIEQIKLRYCPVYENDVKTLLSLCFSYRIDFQKLEEQSQKNAPMCLQIMSKPHLDLFFDLIENKLIKCNTVITHNKDLEEKLKQIYKREMNKDDFMLLISQDKLIPDECKELLLNHLIKKNWLRSTPIGYNINTDDMRQKPLNFNAETTYKIQEIDKTVEKILDNELHLAKIETIQFIANTLKILRSSLQSIIVPEYKLQSLSSLSELKSIEEMHHFSLNALDQILQIKDKKYTRNMIWDCIIPIGTGICKVAAGYLMHIITKYQNTGNAFGNALIKEGLNDLTNGIYTLLPRFFEWKLYTQCKLMNLFSSVCAFGLKTLKKGANVAKFAYKIIKSNLGFNMKITNMSEEALIKTTALNLAEKKVTRLTAAKTIEIVCHSFANVGIVLFMENCLRKLCEEMDTMILSTIEQEIEIELCNISENLEKLYNLLGQHKALNVINGLTNSFFNSQGNLEQFISITCNIAESVAHDVGKSVVETNKIHIMPKFSKSAVEKIMYKLKKSSHITNIRTITKNLLINLNQKIIDKLNKQIKEEELELLNQKLETNENFKCFEREVVNQWKSMLRENVSQIIEKHIVSPISKKGVNHLIKHVRKNIQRVHTYYTEQGYSENFEQLKQICMKNLLQKADEAKEIEEQITEKYHKDLIKLLTKTKNPELYADMIEEGIPMDIACIGASTQIIKRLLKNNGYKKDIKIVIEENNGIKQEFFSLSEEQECITISLKLKDNYFNICKTNTSENDNSESKNNCLYEAVLKEFSPLKDAMSREQFRTEVIDCIKSDKEIRNYIKKGGHQTHSSLRPIDSGLQKLEKTENKDLSIALNEDIYDFEQYRYMRKKRNFYKHILRRFVRNCYLSQCHPKFAHFLSQVQNDTKCSNEWHGETESIDVFPSRNVNISTNTTYTESFTAEDATILKDIRDELKTTIKLFIANENVSDGDLEFWNIFLGDNSVKLLFGKNQNGSTDSTDK